MMVLPIIDDLVLQLAGPLLTKEAATGTPLLDARRHITMPRPPMAI